MMYLCMEDVVGQDGAWFDFKLSNAVCACVILSFLSSDTPPPPLLPSVNIKQDLVYGHLADIPDLCLILKQY